MIDNDVVAENSNNNHSNSTNNNSKMMAIPFNETTSTTLTVSNDQNLNLSLLAAKNSFNQMLAGTGTEKTSNSLFLSTFEFDNTGFNLFSSNRLSSLLLESNNNNKNNNDNNFVGLFDYSNKNDVFSSGSGVAAAAHSTNHLACSYCSGLPSSTPPVEHRSSSSSSSSSSSDSGGSVSPHSLVTLDCQIHCICNDCLVNVNGKTILKIF